VRLCTRLVHHRNISLTMPGCGNSARTDEMGVVARTGYLEGITTHGGTVQKIHGPTVPSRNDKQYEAAEKVM